MLVSRKQLMQILSSRSGSFYMIQPTRMTTRWEFNAKSLCLSSAKTFNTDAIIVCYSKEKWVPAGWWYYSHYSQTYCASTNRLLLWWDRKSTGETSEIEKSI